MTLKQRFEETFSTFFMPFEDKTPKSPDFALSLACVSTVKALQQGFLRLSAGLQLPILSDQDLGVKHWFSVQMLTLAMAAILLWG